MVEKLFVDAWSRRSDFIAPTTTRHSTGVAFENRSSY